MSPRLYPVGLGLPARLSMLGGLFAAEILVVSLWLDAELLRGRGVLAGMVHDWGAWAVRLSVAIVLGTLIFAESRARGEFQKISAACALSRIGWPLLAAHAATMALFVWLSSILFQQNSGGSLSNSLVVAWAIAGGVSLVLAACAVVPVAVWHNLIRSTGDAWIYGFAGALVACALGMAAQSLWAPLSHWTLGLVAAMLRPLVAVLVVVPSTMTIGTPGFQVEIAQSCSGYEGMGLILAFSSAWLWFFRRQWRFPHALILLPAGVALMYLVNAARIAALILIGNAGASHIAAEGFHSQAGWMAFNAVAIGICVVAKRIPALVHHEAVLIEADTSNPTAPYLMPFLAILAAAIVSRSMSAGFEWAYPLRVVAAGGALWYFRRSYRDLDFRFGAVGMGAGVAVFAIWIGLEKAGTPAGAPAALMHASTGLRIVWLALRVVGAVAMVPVAEELAFRGFLLRRLVSADFETVGWKELSWLALLISSAAFGIMHGERWLVGTLAGVVFALAQIRRGRIGEAIAAHAVANALLAAWVLSTGNWQLW